MSRELVTDMATDQIHGIRASARLLTLLRLLLLALALGLLLVLQALTDDERLPWAQVQHALVGLIIVVAVCTAGLAVGVIWIRRRWLLAAQQVFDLVWLGTLIHLTGGVGSPIAPLLAAVVLISNFVLGGGPFPYFTSSIGAAMLAVSAGLYIAGLGPFDALQGGGADLIAPPRVLANLAIQIGVLLLVDAMGRALARRLHEQRLLTGELLDQLGEGVIAVGPDRSVLYVNDAASRLLGTAPIAVGGDAFEHLAAPPFAALRLALVADALPTSLRLDTPDRRHLLVRVNKLIGRNARMLGRTVLVADETRLREFERDAERSERLASLGEMAAGIAHEIRNPLTSLRGCAQEMAAMQRQGSHSDGAALSHIILHEADRLARLVEDFLGMARMRSPEPLPVDLACEFAELRALAERRDDRPDKLVWEFSAAPDLPPVAADPDQLRQVLTNLLDNAVDAVRRMLAPKVALHAAPPGLGAPDDGRGLVEIRVEDNGIGIPADRLEKIFTPFFSTKSRGTGLGLTVVQRIVHAHGGLIVVESRRGGELGSGTTVRIWWPSWAAGASGGRASGSIDAPGTASGLAEQAPLS